MITLVYSEDFDFEIIAVLGGEVPETEINEYVAETLSGKYGETSEEMQYLGFEHSYFDSIDDMSSYIRCRFVKTRRSKVHGDGI